VHDGSLNFKSRAATPPNQALLPTVVVQVKRILKI